MARLMISSSQMCISREQEEFLAAYRTDEARQAFIDSYGKEKVNFLDVGYSDDANKDGYPNVISSYDFDVEYLEVNDKTGVAYIDTLISPNDIPYVIECDFMILGWGVTSGNTRLISWYTTNSEELIMVRSNFLYNYNLMVQFIGATPQRIFNTTNNIKYNLRIDRSLLSVSIDNVTQYFENYSLKPNNTSLLLFGNRETNISYMRLYSFKFYDGLDLIMDLKPVVKSGVGYMYDTVSGTFFAAQGGGSFAVGPRI